MRFKNSPQQQGRGIIMGVTRLLLLGPFYYIALYWGYRIMNNTVCNHPNNQKGNLIKVIKLHFSYIDVANVAQSQ